MQGDTTPDSALQPADLADDSLWALHSPPTTPLTNSQTGPVATLALGSQYAQSSEGAGGVASSGARETAAASAAGLGGGSGGAWVCRLVGGLLTHTTLPVLRLLHPVAVRKVGGGFSNFELCDDVC